MVRLTDYGGLWHIVRHYSEEKGVLRTQSSFGAYSHIMVERGKRVMIVPRQEVSKS